MTIEHDGRKNKVQSLPRSLYAMRGSARWYRPELTAKAHRNSITLPDHRRRAIHRAPEHRHRT